MIKIAILHYENSASDEPDRLLKQCSSDIFTLRNVYSTTCIKHSLHGAKAFYYNERISVVYASKSFFDCVITVSPSISSRSPSNTFLGLTSVW